MTSTPQDPYAAPDPTATAPAESAQPAPAWGQQPYGTAVAAPSNGLGTAALVVGIVAILAVISIIGGILLGVVALILGIVARGRVRRGEATNGGAALAGIILGAAAVVLSIGLVAAGVSLLNSDSGKKLQNCLNSAGNNQEAVDQCQREFQDDFTR